MNKYVPRWFFVIIFPFYLLALVIVVFSVLSDPTAKSPADINTEERYSVPTFKQFGEKYSLIKSVPRIIDGKLFFEAKRNSNSYAIVDRREVLIGGEMESITSGPILVDGSVLFTKTNYKPFLVADGKEYPLYEQLELEDDRIEFNFPIAVNMTLENKIILASEDEILQTFAYDPTRHPAGDPEGKYKIIIKDTATILYIDDEVIRTNLSQFKLGIPFSVNGKPGYTFSVLNEEVLSELKELGYEYPRYDYDSESGYYDYIEKIQALNDEKVKEKIFSLVQIIMKRSIMFDGVDLGENYDYAIEPKVINNKLAYEVEKDGKQSIIYDGVDVGLNYDSADNLQEINDKLFFNVYQNGKRFIVYDGSEYGKEYDDAFTGLTLGNDFAYIGTLMSENARFQEYLNYKGVKYGTGSGEISNPVLIDGEPVFMVHEYLGRKYPGNGHEYPTESIIYKGQKYGGEYDQIWAGPWNINGKLSFIAGDTYTYYFVHDGNKLGIYFNGFGSSLNSNQPLQLNGDTYFLMSKDSDWYLFRNEEMTKLPYTFPNSLTALDGKLMYEATKEGKKIINFDGKEFGNQYENVELAYDNGKPFTIKGELVYFATKNNKKILVYGDQEIGSDYDLVTSPFKWGDKLGFVAKKADESFIMIEE